MLLGRDQLVNDIKSYISSPSGGSTHPYVLVGFPGAGKSALMAYSAKLATGNANYKVRIKSCKSLKLLSEYLSTKNKTK